MVEIVYRSLLCIKYNVYNTYNEKGRKIAIVFIEDVK